MSCTQLGVQLVSQTGRRVVALGPLSSVTELAKIDSVKFIEEEYEAERHNDVASGIVGSEAIENLGYEGEGQIVAVDSPGRGTSRLRDEAPGGRQPPVIEQSGGQQN